MILNSEAKFDIEQNEIDALYSQYYANMNYHQKLFDKWREEIEIEVKFFSSLGFNITFEVKPILHSIGDYIEFKISNIDHDQIPTRIEYINPNNDNYWTSCSYKNLINLFSKIDKLSHSNRTRFFKMLSKVKKGTYLIQNII